MDIYTKHEAAPKNNFGIKTLPNYRKKNQKDPRREEGCNRPPPPATPLP